MISLDQIQILEQKIESAVAKIAQLTAENDALRSKCAELTNALSAKTEQLSAFQTDQNKIELRIKKALEQLENIPDTLNGSFQVEPEEKTTAQESAETSQPESSLADNYERNEEVSHDEYQSSEAEAETYAYETSEATDSAENNTYTEEASSENYENADTVYSDSEETEEMSEEDNSHSDSEIAKGEQAVEESENAAGHNENNESTLSERDISLIFSLRERGMSVTDISSALRKPEAEVEAVLAKQKTEQENDGDTQSDAKPIFDIF